MPTNQALDRLRLAAALAHRVPGARLVLRCAAGAQVTVGRHPFDDLDPCQFRRVVVASSVPGAADLGTYLSPVAIEGRAVDHGGGLYGTTCEHHVTRWFATLLGVDRSRAVLDTVAGAVPGDVMDAGLGIDRQLAVTVVRMTAWDRALEAELDDVARRALAACWVEEVIDSARHDRLATRPRRSRRPDSH